MHKVDGRHGAIEANSEHETCDKIAKNKNMEIKKKKKWTPMRVMKI